MDMELDQHLSFEGWTIKYALLQPAKPPAASQRTVVFVHGTPWSSATFVPLARTLLTQTPHRVLLYDLPGYGQSQAFSSDAPPSPDSLFRGDTSVKFQATALSALLTHLASDDGSFSSDLHVIAHDIAGTIALRAHLLEGCRFSSLVLMDTNCVLPWGDGFYTLARKNPEVFVALPPAIFEAVLRAVIQSGSTQGKNMPKAWEDALAAPWITEDGVTGKWNFVRQIAQANDEDVKAMLDRNVYAEIGCDVKILWGEKDEWIPGEKMERLKGLIGDRVKEFVVIPEAGHLIMVDQPERVMAEVLSWINK